MNTPAAALILVSALTPLQEEPAPDWSRRIQWDAGAGPSAREHAAFVVDGDRAVLLLGSGYQPYGSPLGDAWAFDLESETWTELELAGDTLPPGGSRRAAAVEGGAFLHGGYGAEFAPSGGLWRVAFEPERVVVESIEQENSPPARLLHGFTCDPAGERFVVFGGGSSEADFGDTWIGSRTERGVRWEQLELEGPGPGSRAGFSFARDVALGRLLVCSGQVPPENEEDESAFARDLWALDYTAEAPAWTLLAEYGAEQLPGRRNPAWCFDEYSGDLFVWGGTGDGTTALPDLHVVRTRVAGAPVERVSELAAIPTRASGFGVVDEPRGRALLGFGNTGTSLFRDLVEVRLRGW